MRPRKREARLSHVVAATFAAAKTTGETKVEFLRARDSAMKCNSGSSSAETTTVTHARARHRSVVGGKSERRNDDVGRRLLLCCGFLQPAAVAAAVCIGASESAFSAISDLELSSRET